MKSHNRVLLSCVVASLLSSGAYAELACSPATLITIGDANTTGVVLTCHDNLNVTSAGSVQITNAPYIAVQSSSDGYITNSGIISSTSSTSALGINQNIENPLLGDVTNSGTIRVTPGSSGSGYGIHQYAYGGISGNIINSGTIAIIGNSSHNLRGIDQYAYYGSINADIINSGTITITGEAGAVAEAILQGVSNGEHVNGNIINSGTITVDGTGTAISQFGEGTGSITNTSTGTITAYEAFNIGGGGPGDGGSGIVYTNAIINQGVVDTSYIHANYSPLTNSGTIKLRNSFVSHVRNFTQLASGILSIDLTLFDEGDGFMAISPTLRAESNATIADGSTIHVNVIGNGLEQTFIDQNKTVDDVVVAGGNMTVNPDNIHVTDNSDVLDFEAYMNGENALGLKLVEGEVTPTPTPTPEERPEVVVATPTLGAETLNVLNTIVQKREYSANGLGGGDIAFADKHFWVKPFGVYTKQNDKDGKNGFDANTYGFGIGVDGEYSEGKRAGLAFFYSNSSLDINNVNQESDLDAFNFIAYGSNPVINDQSRLFYQAGAGFQKNTSKRYLTGQTAKADYTSRSFYAQVKAVRYYAINDKLTITPAVEGSYRYFYTPSYSETGAGTNNLNVQSSSTSQLLLGALTKLEYKIDDNTHFVSNVALTYDFQNDASSVNASYQGGGAVFNTRGIKNSALSYELGIGIARKINKNMVVDVKYDLYGKGSSFINHAVLAKLKWSF